MYLFQLVKESTRVVGNTLDIVLTNDPGVVTEIQVVPGLSNHYAIVAKIINLFSSLNRNSSEHVRKQCRFDKTNSKTVV